MTLTPEQFDALCEAAEHADDKTMFHVRAVVNAILPLHRAMVIEECAKHLETSGLYSTANHTRALAKIKALGGE